MSDAFLTLVTSDSYAIGAVNLRISLKKSNSTIPVAVLVTSDTLSQSTIITLEKYFDKVIFVLLITSQSPNNLQVLGRPDLDSTLTKLCVFDSDLIHFNRVCFLDADTIIQQNIDSIFDYVNGDIVFAAAPDIGWPDCFNSGVFVTKPNKSIYNQLYAFLYSTPSFDGGDQGLLNSFFSSWSGHYNNPLLPVSRLPFTYNVTPSSFYSYLPAFIHYQHEIKVIHFIGKPKPWDYSRTENGTLILDPLINNTMYINKLESWWMIFDTFNLHEDFNDKKHKPVIKKETIELIHNEKPPIAPKNQEKIFIQMKPHSSYDYQYAKSPGKLSPLPPPLPKMSPAMTQSRSNQAESFLKESEFKVDWDNREISKQQSSKSKLIIENDIELRVRDLSLDGTIARKKMVKNQLKMRNEFVWELSGGFFIWLVIILGTGRYKNLFKKNAFLGIKKGNGNENQMSRKSVNGGNFKDVNLYANEMEQLNLGQ